MSAPLPPFYWTIQSLRVDGDASADARDYAHVPEGRPVGLALHAFLVGHLSKKLSPAKALTLVPQFAVEVQPHPTRADLRRWASVRRLRMTVTDLHAMSDQPKVDMGELVRRAQELRKRRTPSDK